MPATTFYRHGLTASIPNMGNPNPPKRGKVQGWSDTSARRNVNFLRSVDETQLTGSGIAVTLTVRDCPPSPAAWSNMVASWIKRQRRASPPLIRLHWVMEFQRRGVPHLHAAAWYDYQLPPDADPNMDPVVVERCIRARLDWVEIAFQTCGAGFKGQFTRPIDGVVGWFQYMAKHCSRSKRHYQRQREAMPTEWDSSPRVWGYRGDWVLQQPATADITHQQFYRLRRLVMRARLAEARAALPLNARQVGYVRRLLKCNDRDRSSVRPVSEWVPEAVQRRLLDAACSR